MRCSGRCGTGKVRAQVRVAPIPCNAIPTLIEVATGGDAMGGELPIERALGL
jgi:hypothetical protein